MKRTPYQKYREEMNKLDEKVGAKRKKLLIELQEHQKLCSHKDSTYHPDPSGNNDSYYQCNWCGCEV